MNCNDFEEQINLLVDGELKESLHAALYAHLEQCSACRALIDGILRSRQILQNDQPAFPDELDYKVLRGSQLHGKARPPFLSRRPGVPIPVAAAAVVVLVIAAFVLGRSLRSEPPAQNQETQAALVSTEPRVEVLYGLPAIEVVGYPTQIKKSDSLLEISR